MAADPQISQVVFDFDGTCTQIPVIFEAYLGLYRQGLVNAGFDISEADWSDVQSEVRRHSPEAGWMAGGCPAAPAAADPYMLASEAAKLILQQRHDSRPIPNVHTPAYTTAVAPWREEMRDILLDLRARDVDVAFVSNSSSSFIRARLEQLLVDRPDVLRDITVQSDAGKFQIRELDWFDESAIAPEARSAFTGLPAAQDGGLSRPIYLRRGAYFKAITAVLKGNIGRLANTLFCGDVWEMDLSMPFALGARIHLIERAQPFSTYPYELKAVADCGARALRSTDLSGLMRWFE